MATRRSTILVEVLNLNQLQQLNRDLSVHNTRLQALTATYINFNAATAAASAATGRLASQFVTINNTVNNVNRSINTTTNNIQHMGNAANHAGGQFGGMLGTMLQYRAVSAVFETVTKTITAAAQAMYDMERQGARSARVLGAGSAPGTRADIAVEASRTGASIEQIGEALYQLAPFVKETDARFAALRATMNLVIGTESEARETARALIQIYNEFGDQLDQTASKEENLTRIGNMVAIMFTETNTEVNELIQSIKYLGPVAATLHVPLEKMLALVGALDKAGLRSSTAGTGSAAFLSQFIRRYQDKLPGRDYGGIQYKGKEYAFEAVRDPVTGGLDPIATIRKVKDATDALRASGAAGTKQAEMMWAAVGGSERSGRVLGALLSVNNVLEDAEKLAAKLTAEHNRTSDAAEKLRVTMTTTAQEFQRAWGGAISAIANMLDTSGLRSFFRDAAEGFQRMNEAARGVVGTEASARGILGGQGFFPGDPRAASTQTQFQLRTLQDVLREAQSRGLTGSVRIPDALSGPQDAADLLIGGSRRGDAARKARSLYDETYERLTAPEKGFLQQFMQFKDRGFLQPREVTMDLAAMQREVDRLKGMAARPGGPVVPANPFGPGLATRPGGGLPGFGKPPAVGDTLEAIEQRAKEAKSKADKEERERLQAAQKMADAAHIQYQKALKDWGPEDPRTKNEAKMSDLLAKMAADSNEQLRLRYGLTGDVKENEEAIVEAREKQLKLSEKELKAREEAMEKRRDLYRAGGVFGGGVETSIFPFPKDAIEAFQGRPDVKKGIADAKYAAEVIKARAEAWEKDQDADVERLRAIGDRERRALQRGLRPNLLSGGDARQEAMLTADIAAIQAQTKTLTDVFTIPTDATRKELERLAEELADANAALTDFHDTLAAKARDREIQAQEDAYDYNARQIGRRHGLRFLRDEQSEFADQMQQLTETLALEQQRVKDAAAIANDQYDPRLRDAKQREQQARERLADAPTEYGNRRYAEEYYRVQGTVHGALMDFFHGQGDLGDVAQGIGGTIVDAALEQQIKKFSDPLVQAVTGEILALQGNTEALKALYLSLTGGGGGISYGGAAGGGIAGAIAAGVVMGFEEGAGGPVKDAGAAPQGPQGLGKFGRYASQGLAAYSVFAQGQEQGSTLGSVLGAALAGGAIGGPLGAVVGAGLNLLGGLFKQRSKPTDEPRDLSPALYNAPSAFDLAAYHYSAYGLLPRMQDVGFDVKPANTPVFNVYIDGARTAAQVEIGRQSSSINVSLVNSNRDRYVPI